MKHSSSICYKLNHEMSLPALSRLCLIFFLWTMACPPFIHPPFASAFSPPVCPCRLNVPFTCQTLPSLNDCEIVYDACGCCPKCALGLSEECQAFGVRCKKGLVCLWERFWYDEPIAGKCVYDQQYIRYETNHNLQRIQSKRFQ